MTADLPADLPGMDCYVRGCHTPAAGELELLVGNDLMVPLHLCRRHYRQAWDTDRLGWWGGSGVD